MMPGQWLRLVLCDLFIVLTVMVRQQEEHLAYNNPLQLISSGELIRVIVQNVSKISQTVFEISKFFDFQEAAIRHLGFLNFW